MQLTLHALKITDEQFEQVVRANPEWKFEQTATGEIVIVPPTGGTSGRKNLDLSVQFGSWVKENSDLGEGFDSSTLFRLPNGAKRSPDASWVKRNQWNALTWQRQWRFPPAFKLTRKQQDGYVPLCPDFVVELRSPSDSLEDLQAKMREYMEGAQLGWLIDPLNSQVEVYRQGQEVEVLQSPTQLSGEEVLPGFVLRLERIWN